jgi:hypothetical protein
MGAIPACRQSSEDVGVAAEHFAKALDSANKAGATLSEWMGLAHNDQRLRAVLGKIARNVRDAHEGIMRGVECSGLGKEVDARRTR